MKVTEIERHINVYTDGSIRNANHKNPDKDTHGSSGFIIEDSLTDEINKQCYSISDPSVAQTEIIPILLSLCELVYKIKLEVSSEKSYPGTIINYYIDNKTCVSTITDYMYKWNRFGWKKYDGTEPSNMTLWKKIFNLKLYIDTVLNQYGYFLAFTWIPSHTKFDSTDHIMTMNQQVDALVNEVSDTSTSKDRLTVEEIESLVEQQLKELLN